MTLNYHSTNKIISFAFENLTDIQKTKNVSRIWKDVIKYHGSYLWNRLKNKNDNILFEAANLEDTDLFIGLINGYDKCIELLLNIDNIDINYNKSGTTALTMASQKGYDKCIELLCKDKRIDINAKRHDGFTALHIAKNYPITKSVEILEKYGAK
jgi:ankyrin repeat protein